VEAVQSRLHNLGYDVGPADGLDGQRTRVAVALFQRALGLEPSGDVDAQTRAALRSAHGC
jgi:peptidoglycan hydrolase-like protein with peptidoglycan-binding domain